MRLAILKKISTFFSSLTFSKKLQNRIVIGLGVLIIALIGANQFASSLILKIKNTTIIAETDGGIPTSVPTSSLFSQEASLPINSKHRLMAFVKSTNQKTQEVWIYDFNTKKQYRAFPAIDTNKFCVEGCPTRSLSFSNDGMQLAADLIINGNEKGFGFVNLGQKDEGVHYIHSGYYPVWSPDGHRVLFEEGFEQNNTTTKVISLRDSTIVKFNKYIGIDWLSNTEIALFKLNSDEEAGVFYSGNALTGTVKKISIPELVSRGEQIHTIKVSPSKSKLLIFSRKIGVNKLSIAQSDGSNFKMLFNVPAGIEEYYAAWSTDEQKIAFSVWPNTTSIPRSVSVFDVAGKLTKKIYGITLDPETPICLIVLPDEEFIVIGSGENDGEIHLHNVANDTILSVPTHIGGFLTNRFVCY